MVCLSDNRFNIEMTKNKSIPFWKLKKLSEMSQDEWESLCDGCGKCCLVKLQDEETDDIYYTSLSCQLLNIKSCKCSDYKNRHKTIPDCLQFTHDIVKEITWLPETCAYRLLEEGKDLFWWHPLVSGDPNSVHEAGISVRDWAINEKQVAGEGYHKYILYENDSDDIES